MPRNLAFSIFISLLLLPCLAGAQSPQDEYFRESIETREFDEEKWKTLREDIDYTVEKREEKEKEQEQQTGSDFDPGPAETVSGIGTFLQYFIIIAGIILLIVLLVMVLSKEGLFSPKNKKLDPVSAMELEMIEENLEEAELNDPIRRAIAGGNYALAVRLYYLAVLKELTLKDLIRWKRDKTNGEYLRELAGKPIASTVHEATLIFERVWYGKVSLGANDFQQVETKLKNAIAAVQQA